MSEYQYYEFRALDRPLTQKEIADLRQLSSRAEITSHRFVNNYSYGSARFTPTQMVEKYFDVFLYLANWGSHEFMVRVPRGTFELRSLLPYTVDHLFRIWESGEHLIFHYEAHTEDGGGWVDEEEGVDWLDQIVEMREGLLNGDLRGVYLGWLATLWQDNRDEDDDAVEPPVPPGLGQLSKSLKALAEFIWLDSDMLDVAAEASPPLATVGDPSSEEQARWIASLPKDQQEAYLLRVMLGDGTTVGRELMRGFRSSTATPQVPVTSGRTVEQIRLLWEDWAKEQKRRAAEKKAREQAAKAKKAAEERDRYLQTLVGRESKLWKEVETAIQTSKPKEYVRAIELLKDLRDLASRSQQGSDFQSKLAELVTKHERRSSLIGRLRALQQAD